MAKKEAKTNNKENNKNKKSFLKSFKAELKKVVWPTPKQLVNNTIAVITIVLITAAIVFVLDFTFEAINKNGIDKIKEVINTTNSTSEENVNSEDVSDENTTSEDNTNTSSEENVEADTQNNNTENNTEVVE